MPLEDPRKDDTGASARVSTVSLMDWTALDRELVLIGMNAAYAIVVVALLYYLPHTTLGPFLHAGVLEGARLMTLGVGVGWVAMLAIGRHLRQRGRTEPMVLHLFVQTWTVHNLVLIYCVGMYHTPLWLLLAAGVMMALLLIERRPIYLAGLTAVSIIIALSIGQLTGLVPYAPLFVRPPFLPDGSPQPVWLYVQLLAIAVLMLGIWLVGDRLVLRWREREDTFRALSIMDPLTQLPNRRRFMEVLERECRRANRQGTPIALLMCDVDHFKKVNDDHGHAMGDSALKGLADVFRSAIREHVDTPGRLGGEEFAVLLPGSELTEAVRVAERIRHAVEVASFEHGCQTVRMTISIGAVAAKSAADPGGLLGAADARLYEAKRTGRNKVVGGGTEPSELALRAAEPV